MLVNADLSQIQLHAPSDARRITIFADEASTSGSRFTGYGGIWITPTCEAELRLQLRMIQDQHGMRPTTEFKWVKLSGKKAHPAYPKIIKAFFSLPGCHFKALVVDNQNQGVNRGDDVESDYYRWIHWLVRRRCETNTVYRVFIDKRTGQQASRLNMLRDVLNNSARKDGYATYDAFREVAAIDSSHDSIIQLTDVLLGAVCYHFNERHVGVCSASKKAVARSIALSAGFPNGVMGCTLPSARKFNVWHWNPTKS